MLLGVLLLGVVTASPNSAQTLEASRGAPYRCMPEGEGDATRTTNACVVSLPVARPIQLVSRADAVVSHELEDLMLAIAPREEGGLCMANSPSKRFGLYRRRSLGEDPGTTLFENGFESGGLDAWSAVATQECPATPTSLMGCPACAAFCNADPWNVSWTAVPGASHYVLEYQCSLSVVTYQTTSTDADLCSEVGLCTDGNCSFGVGPIRVQACNAANCSPKVAFDPTGIPTACGGGVCC